MSRIQMEKTLKVLNRMVTDAVITGYAICGAVAAMRYIEPFQTSDLDVMVVFPNESESALGALVPIYQYLGWLGYKLVRESIQIEDWPV